ncbi:MAG: hypothetical protein R6U52_11425 [Kosmotogaceae bacterium]
MSRKLVILYDVAVIALAIWLFSTYSQWFILITSGIFLFPFLRMIGVIKGLDEREKYLDRLSSNITVIVVLLMAMFIIAIGMELTRDVVLSFILITIITKASFFAGFTFSREKVIAYIGRVMALIYLGFVILSHGFSIDSLIQSIPGIIFLVLTELSRKWRWPAAGFIGYIALISYYYVPKLANPAFLMTYLLLTIPVIVITVRTFEKIETQ